jgi:hypothetical protein
MYSIINSAVLTLALASLICLTIFKVNWLIILPLRRKLTCQLVSYPT